MNKSKKLKEKNTYKSKFEKKLSFRGKINGLVKKKRNKSSSKFTKIKNQLSEYNKKVYNYSSTFLETREPNNSNPENIRSKKKEVSKSDIKYSKFVKNHKKIFFLFNKEELGEDYSVEDLHLFFSLMNEYSKI